MGNPWIKQGLVIATLTALVSGCSAWTGPRAAVEDRKIGSPDRTRAAATKAKASPRKMANREETKQPQREERQAAREHPRDASGAHAVADATSGDQILELKPGK